MPSDSAVMAGSRGSGPPDGSGSPPPVVVIGTGPYGLSVAAHLAALGLRTRVFGQPMATWRQHMPKGMFLKSTPAASSIAAPRPGFSLRDFCAATGAPPLGEDQAVPIDLFERYGLWFQRRLVPWVEPLAVSRVAPAEVGLPAGGARRRFHLVLESGEEVDTDAVVVATGLMPYAHIPPELAELAASGLVTHSSRHRDLSSFAGTRVAVIGGGQSSLETAALLCESGAEAHVLVRAPQIRFAPPPAPSSWLQSLRKPDSPMGPGWSLFALHRGASLFPRLPLHTRLQLVRSVLGPSGAWWLRDRVDGRVDVRTANRIRAATPRAGGPIVLHLSDANRRAEQLSVDHVIAATGYRVDVAALDFLALSRPARLVLAGGSPRLTAGFESSLPGLYFVGLASAATFGPLLRFVCGTEFAAPRVSAAVATSLHSGVHS